MSAREKIPQKAWESRESQGSSHIKVSERAGQLWLKPVILDTWEAKIRWIML
jgi:hypothetical protein